MAVGFASDAPGPWKDNAPRAAEPTAATTATSLRPRARAELLTRRRAETCAIRALSHTRGLVRDRLPVSAHWAFLREALPD